MGGDSFSALQGSEETKKDFFKTAKTGEKKTQQKTEKNTGRFSGRRCRADHGGPVQGVPVEEKVPFGKGKKSTEREGCVEKARRKRTITFEKGTCDHGRGETGQASKWKEQS